MDKYSFPPCDIFNCDETGISVVHTNTLKVLSVKGKQRASNLTSGERGRNITALLCINAAGISSSHFICIPENTNGCEIDEGCTRW